jgi:hypothetical protein
LNNYISAAKKMQQKIVDTYLQDLADFILSDAQRNLEFEPSTKAFDSGALANSGTSKHEKNKVIVGFGGPESKDYALAVEFGTDPGHRPPIAPLIAWARRVGIPKPEKVAWAIAKTIEKTGLRERPFLRSAVEKGLREAPRIWNDAVKNSAF